jgi:hypothetical protein
VHSYDDVVEKPIVPRRQTTVRDVTGAAGIARTYQRGKQRHNPHCGVFIITSRQLFRRFSISPNMTAGHTW